MEGMRVSERELRICIAGEQARAQGSQRLLNCPDIHLCPLAISSSVWTSLGLLPAPWLADMAEALVIMMKRRAS